MHLNPEELDALREQWGRTYGHLAGPFKHPGYSVATLNPDCPHYRPSR